MQGHPINLHINCSALWCMKLYIDISTGFQYPPLLWGSSQHSRSVVQPRGLAMEPQPANSKSCATNLRLRKYAQYVTFAAKDFAELITP